jgi:hypothetical protein
LAQNGKIALKAILKKIIHTKIVFKSLSGFREEDYFQLNTLSLFKSTSLYCQQKQRKYKIRRRLNIYSQACLGQKIYFHDTATYFVFSLFLLAIQRR